MDRKHIGTEVRRASVSLEGEVSPHVEIVQEEDGRFRIFTRYGFHPGHGPTTEADTHRRKWQYVEQSGTYGNIADARQIALSKAQERTVVLYGISRESDEKAKVLWHPVGWEPLGNF